MLFPYTFESICSLRLTLWTASSLFSPSIITQGLLKQSLFLTIDKVICNGIWHNNRCSSQILCTDHVLGALLITCSISCFVMCRTASDITYYLSHFIAERAEATLITRGRVCHPTHTVPGSLRTEGSCPSYISWRGSEEPCLPLWKITKHLLLSWHSQGQVSWLRKADSAISKLLSSVQWRKVFFFFETGCFFFFNYRPEVLCVPWTIILLTCYSEAWLHSPWHMLVMKYATE